MPYMAPTEVMMLGRVQPPLRQGYLNPPRTTPSFPQNLLRQTMMGGLGKLGVLTGLGAPTDPNQLAVPVAIETYDQIGAPFPGQSVATDPAPIATPLQPNGQVVHATDGTARPAGYDMHSVWSHVGAERRGTIFGIASLALISGVISGIHGWNRDKTSIAAWGWFTLGSMFPVITPVVAIAQGYGKRRGRR